MRPVRGAAAVLLLATTSAHAAPWRLETGLPPPPATNLPDGEAASATGLVHPSLRLGDFRIGLMGDLFVTFEAARRQGAWWTEVELSRAQFGGFVAFRDLAGLHVSLESIRSSSDRSYIGIDGDSLLPRFKWAFVEVTPLGRWLALRAGLVPDLLVPALEASWDLRVQGPTALERDGLFFTADLGATVEAALPWRLGSVALSLTNGEGPRLREMNNGKNVTAALRLTPLRERLPGLALHLLYRDGSAGTDSGVGPAADSRAAAALLYTGPRFGAGLAGTVAIGYQGHGEWTAAGATGWVRGALPGDVLLFARGDALWPDVGQPGDVAVRAIAGIGWALPSLARIVGGWEATLPIGGVAAMVPSVEEQRLLLQVEGRL